jgi:hypothetical protein
VLICRKLRASSCVVSGRALPKPLRREGALRLWPDLVYCGEQTSTVFEAALAVLHQWGQAIFSRSVGSPPVGVCVRSRRTAKTTNLLFLNRTPCENLIHCSEGQGTCYSVVVMSAGVTPVVDAVFVGINSFVFVQAEIERTFCLSRAAFCSRLGSCSGPPPGGLDALSFSHSIKTCAR